MSALDFYVQSLNVEVTSTEALLAGLTTQDFSADVNASMNIDLNTVKSLFRFHSDGIEITDASATDITYRVKFDEVVDPIESDVLTSTWLADVAVESGDEIFDAQSAVSNQTVPFEYVRYLAKKLFNTHLGVDLFSNESELRTDLHNNAKVAMNTHLTNLNDLENNEVGAENVAYLDAEQCVTGDFSVHHHPTYAILQKIILDAPSRLSDLSSNMIPGTEAYPEFYMPFEVNDKIYFKLTVKAATGQHDLTNVAAIPDRTYKVKMTIV